MRTTYYWAHCEACEEHFETKTGICTECRAGEEHVKSCDAMAEKHRCEDCIYIVQLEDDLARAREIIARKKAVA